MNRPKASTVWEEIREAVAEMNSEHNDGYKKKFYRDWLTEIADYLAKVLKDDNNN